MRLGSVSSVLFIGGGSVCKIVLFCDYGGVLWACCLCLVL